MRPQSFRHFSARGLNPTYARRAKKFAASTTLPTFAQAERKAYA
jgi:hypothetical protein